MNKLFLCTIALCCSLIGNSQVTNEGTPLSWSLLAKRSIDPIRMPSFDLKKIQAEDLINDNNMGKPYRFGYEFTVDIGIKNAGTWDVFPNGDRIWRVNFVSEGAKTLNFIFNEYKLPKGAKLYIYSKDKTDLLGAYTDVFNRPDEVLGTWMVSGDDIVIEYFEPGSADTSGKLNISKVVHGYRSVSDAEIQQKGLNEAGDCNLDVDCSVGSDFDTLKDELKRSVALFILGGGSCSGTLINNTDNDRKPYFLSANHCYQVEDNDPSNPAVWAFRFNWVSPSPSCATTESSAQGTYNQTTSGASLLASNSKSDMILVNIDTNLPDEWNLEWAGWDVTGDIPDFVVGIHHPRADIMKVCREDDPLTKVSLDFNGNPSASVWQISDWDLGVTHRGSSGSALFDQVGRIIGKLSGGQADCSGTVTTTDNDLPDYYGRLEVSWDFGTTNDARLSNWLDPGNTGRTTLNSLSEEVLSVVDEPEAEPKVGVYSNPSEGAVYVYNSTENELQYDLYNVIGQRVAGGQVAPQENKTIDVSIQADGLYIISVKDFIDNLVVTKKIVIGN